MTESTKFEMVITLKLFELQPYGLTFGYIDVTPPTSAACAAGKRAVIGKCVLSTAACQPFGYIST